MYRKLVVIICGLALYSCGVSDEKISPEERLMIDTLSTSEIVRSRLEWDRQCNLKMDSMVKYAIDSLTSATLKKIDQKIKPYQ